MRAGAVLAALLALSSCRRTRPPPDPGDTPSPGLPARPTPPPRPAPPTAPWCWRALPHADVRALDAQGAVWSVRGTHLIDETHSSALELQADLPCPMTPAWALAFDADDRGYALLGSRFYVRAGRNDTFRLTPLCTNVGGAPWSALRARGFGLVTTPPRAGGRALLLTNDPHGAMGWYAVTALEETITHAVLDEDRSMATLSSGGHLVVVDQRRIVAGEVLATRSETFAGLRRTPAGVVAWRDASPTLRVVVGADALGGEFTRLEGSHPASRTLAVMRLDLARLVAVTDRGVELSSDNGSTWASVLARPMTADDGARAAAGWLPQRHPALALPDGLATDDCTPSHDPPDGAAP